MSENANVVHEFYYHVSLQKWTEATFTKGLEKLFEAVGL
jgi:hypothetical protein